MPLIKCPEPGCNTQVSSQADSCPTCGCPIDPHSMSLTQRKKMIGWFVVAPLIMLWATGTMFRDPTERFLALAPIIMLVAVLLAFWWKSR